MPIRNYEDPPVLFVDKNLTRNPNPASNDYNPLYYSLAHYASDAEQRKRAVLCGFSFFGEVAGLDGDEGINVDPTYTGTPDLDGGLYRISFDQYLDRLQAKKINYMRLFLFQLYRAPFGPFKKNGSYIYNLMQDDLAYDEYLNRLELFIQKARARGIIICLSLFSSQMIAGGAGHNWDVNPFNDKNNTDDIISDAAGNPPPTAYEYFCDIKKSGGTAQQMKLYAVQERLITKVVQKTKPYWNVMYELFNEPGGPGDSHPIKNVVEWHAEAVGWINRELADKTGKRTRLIAVTAVANLLMPLLDRLGAAATNRPGMIDILGLHGAQWGGRDNGRLAGNVGGAIGRVCSSVFEPAPDNEINNGITVQPDNDGPPITYPGILTAIETYKDRWLALIFDTDAHYQAQKYPAAYVKQTLKAFGSYNYRWGETFLNEVDQFCNTTSPVRCGIDQRLTKLFEFQEDVGKPAVKPRITGFPKPPGWAPVLNAVTVSDQFFNLNFTPAAGQQAEGYIAYFGSLNPQGALVFTDYAPVEKIGTQYRVLRLASTVVSTVFVAVAARNGLAPGPLSNNKRVDNVPITKGLDTELVEWSLPAVQTGHAETRRDFKGWVKFKNKGTQTWIGRVAGENNSLTTLGVYMQVSVSAGGSDLVFVPMLSENFDPGQPEIVKPGETVKINMNRMQVRGSFEQFNGQTTPLLMPYSRSELKFNLGMGRLSTQPSQASYGHFGTVYQNLPNGMPLKFIIDKPKRLVQQLPPQTVTLASQQSFAMPLSTAKDFKHHLVSVTTTSTASAGTIIRAVRRLEYIRPSGTAPATGVPARVLRVSNNGTQPVQVKISAVELRAVDIYYAGPHVSPKYRFYDLAANGVATAPLTTFDNRFHITSAWSDAVIEVGKAVDWETAFSLGTPPTQTLEISNKAPVGLRINTGTAEIWEDIAAAQDPRQLKGTLTFGPGSPPPQYVSLQSMNNCGGEHRYFLASLRCNGTGRVRYSIVLRANQSGVFEPCLEVIASSVVSPFTVEYRVLEECVDTVPFP